MVASPSSGSARASPATSTAGARSSASSSASKNRARATASGYRTAGNSRSAATTADVEKPRLTFRTLTRLATRRPPTTRSIVVSVTSPPTSHARTATQRPLAVVVCAPAFNMPAGSTRAARHAGHQGTEQGTGCGDGQGKHQRGGVELHLVEARDGDRRTGKDGTQGDRRHRVAQRAAGTREHGAFDCDERGQAPPSRSHRRADRQLALTSRPPRPQEAGDVHADDEQRCRNRAEHQPERTPGVGRDQVGERSDDGVRDESVPGRIPFA